MNDTTELYQFRLYDPQLPIEVLEGQRLVKCLYKTPKGKTKPSHPNEYVLVPTAHLADSVLRENSERLLPYISAFLRAEEDRLIKEAHKKQSKGFGASWFSLDKILAALDEAGKSGRLKKEDIENWFMQYMYEPLEVAFAEKLGLTEESSKEELLKIETIVETYKARLASLASGKVWYKEADKEALLRALEVTGVAATEIGTKLQHRLEGMKEQQEDLIAAL